MQLQNMVGFVLPPLIDIINKHIKSDAYRYWTSMIICLIVGSLVNLEKITSPGELLSNTALVFATAQTTYNIYWKKSKSRKKFIK